MKKHLLNASEIALAPLTGILTVISMFAANAYHLHWGELWLPLSYGIIIGLICFGVLWIFKSIRKVASTSAAFLTLIFMIWFSFDVSIRFVVMIIGILVLALLNIFFRYKYKINITHILTAVVILACVISLTQAAFSMSGQIEGGNAPSIVMKDKPNIYFIVPDRYSSQQGLSEAGYDDSAFVVALESYGFYVNPDKLSLDQCPQGKETQHTSRTARFFASVMNMGIDISLMIGYQDCTSKIPNSEVAKILLANGYTYDHIGSWYLETENDPVATLNYMYKSNALLSPSDEFAYSVLDRSILKLFANSSVFWWMTSQDSEMRNEAIWQADTIEALSKNNISPKFVFAHILLPHYPNIFTADGSPQNAVVSPMQGYLAQVAYTSQYLLQIVKAIDANDPNAIVIIQADEGLNTNDASVDVTLTNEQWNGVLSAWKIPNNISDLQDIPITGILKYVIEECSK